MFGIPSTLNGKFTYPLPSSYSYLFTNMSYQSPFVRQRFAVTDLNGELDTSVSIGSGFAMASVANMTGLDVDSSGRYYVAGGNTSSTGITYNGTSISSYGGGYARINTDGTLDTTFYGGLGKASAVTAYTRVGPDNKVYVYGDFTTVYATGATGSYTVNSSNCIRLNADGTRDVTFPTPNFNAMVRDIQFQSDNKIIAVGNFASYAGATGTRVIRLNTDGSKDTSFTPTTIASEVTTASIDSSGKIYIGGLFAPGRIRRLNTDGTTDTTFVLTGTGFNQNVNKVLAVDDKVYVGGVFTTYGGTAANGLARLNSDGSLDTGFNTTVGVGGLISSTTNQVRDIIKIGSNILVVGDFNYYNNVYAPGRVLLDSTGAIVNTFTGDCYPQGIVKVVQNTAANRLTFSGGFQGFGIPETRGISITDQSGVIQNTYNLTGKYGNGITFVNPVTLNTTTGGYWIVNNNTNIYFENNLIGRVAKVDSNFNYVSGFNYYGPGTSFSLVGHNNNVNRVLHDSVSGGYYAVGSFLRYNDIVVNRISKVGSTGVLDTAFHANAGTGFSNNLTKIIDFAGGLLVAAGTSGTYNTSTTFPRIIKLNTNGTVDTSFVMGTGFNAELRDIQVDPNTGSVYCIGTFTLYNGNAASGIVKLLPNGSIDTSFAYGLGFQGGSPRAMAVLPNGDLYVVGAQASYNDVSVPAMFKLKANGTIDTTFNITESNVTSGTASTNTLTIVEDGKVLLLNDAANITYKGVTYFNAVKINPDSSVDTFTFPYNRGTNITFLN